MLSKPWWLQEQFPGYKYGLTILTGQSSLYEVMVNGLYVVHRALDDYAYVSQTFKPTSTGPCASTMWRRIFHFLLFQMHLIILAPNWLMVASLDVTRVIQSACDFWKLLSGAVPYLRWGATVTALAIKGKAILDNLHNNFSLKLLIKESVENNVNMQGAHLILYSCTFLFILEILVAFQQELIISPTMWQHSPLMRRLSWVIKTTFH